MNVLWIRRPRRCGVEGFGATCSRLKSYKSKSLMEHAKHIIRAVLLLVVAAVLFVLVRHALIPASFGEYGHYRYLSVAEYASLQPLHGAPDGCNDCHEEQAEARAEGKHASVSCEVCHAPLATHVLNDERVAPMTVRRSTQLCGWCHERLIARRATMPQVHMTDHVIEKDGELTEAACLECHNAHNPSE